MSTQPTKAYGAEMGLQSSILYMYSAYTEEEGCSPEEAKLLISEKVLKELNKLNINTNNVQSELSKNKPFILKDMKKNIEVLMAYNNKQIQYVAKALMYNLKQLMQEAGLK